MNRLVALFSLSLLMSPLALGLERFPYQGESTLRLPLGAIENVRVSDITRIAVGNEDVVSVNVLNEEELLIIPLSEGNSDIVVWHLGNRKSLFHIQVSDQAPSDSHQQLARLIIEWPSLTIDYGLSKPLITGVVVSEFEHDRFQNLLASASLQDQVITDIRVQSQSHYAALREILAPIAGIEIAENQGRLVVSGSYDPRFQSHLAAVLEQYPTVINMTLENPAPHRKMIEISVQILEVKKRNLERLGIRWQEILSGPSIALAQQAVTNPYFAAISPIQGAEALIENIPLSDGQFYGAVGLASHMQSQIELLTETGSARVVAKPMLSTTENRPATFHAGGQIPYPVLSESGDLRVQYQPYGIRLNVLPTIGADGNLLVDFSAEVSSIDHAISVNGVPGLSTRQVTSVANTEPGETVVISGLVSQTENASVSKVPWLGNLPFVGRFFRAKTTDNNDMELIILLTPTISQADAESDLNNLANKLVPDKGHSN